MLSATFYKFAKKENSTAIPGTSQASLPASIIVNDGDSSILSPSIRVPTDQTGLPSGTRIFDYNYIYIPDFARYYYVDNWSYNADGTWTADCSVDVLASWKSQIQSSAGYVGRCATAAYVDPYVQDRFYISRNTPVTIRDNANTGLNPSPILGTYVLAVSSAKYPGITAGGNLGCVSYYMMTATDFQSLGQNLLGIFNNGSWTTPAWQIREDSLFKADNWMSLNSPAEFIVSCRFYPALLFDATATREQIVMGGYQVGGTGGVKIVRLYDETTWNEISISDVGSVGQYSPDDYPTYAPYASYILQAPWGEFALDPNIMSTVLRRTTPKLYWKLLYNFVTGMATFVVTDDASQTFPESVARSTTHELIRTEIKIGADIPLQAIMQDELHLFKSVSNALSGFFDMGAGFVSALGSGFGGNMGGIGSGINQFAQGGINTASSVVDAVAGAQKTAYGVTNAEAMCSPVIAQISVQQTRYSTVTQAPAMFGKPSKRPVASLSGFSGFVQMDYSQFNAECTDTERSRVISFLQGGVYIE